MLPNTENITNPAKNDVKQLPMHTINMENVD